MPFSAALDYYSRLLRLPNNIYVENIALHKYHTLLFTGSLSKKTLQYKIWKRDFYKNKEWGMRGESVEIVANLEQMDDILHLYHHLAVKRWLCFILFYLCHCFPHLLNLLTVLSKSSPQVAQVLWLLEVALLPEFDILCKIFDIFSLQLYNID